MREGLDAKEPSVMYSWKAINVDISSKEFDISADLVNSGSSINPLLELEINPLKNDVKGGSYVPVEVKVKNLQDYYLSTLVFFTIAPEIINGNKKAVLLNPKQEKSLFWILKIDDVNDRNKYLSLLEVQDSFGSKDESTLNFARDGEFLNLEDVKEIVDKLEEVEDKKYKYDLVMDCSLDKTSYYKDESAVINCNLKNIGTIPLDFDLCFDKDCEEVELKIAEERVNSFRLDLKDKKSEILTVEAKSENIELSSFLDLKVFDEPKVEVLALNYNSTVKYNEEGNYELLLDVKPEVYDMKVKITGSRILKMDKFFGKQRINLPFKAWRIGAGEQVVDVLISYRDKNGKLYGVEKKYKINIEDIPVLDKFLLNVKDLMMFV